MESLQRNNAIDMARAIAAFGVIAIHVAFNTPAAEGFNTFFSPLCVPFFYVISLTYFITSLKSASLSDTFSRAWWRIMVPYLAWTLIYVALLATKTYITGGHRSFVIWKILFYGDSAVQLYFLPQLIAMQLLILAIYLLGNRTTNNIIISMLLIALVTFYLIVGYNNNCFGVNKPITIITCILFAFLLSLIIKDQQKNITYLTIGILLVTVAELREFLGRSFNPFPVLNFIPIGGLGLALIAMNIQIKRLPKWLAILTTTTLGIYLSHILFLETFEFVEQKVWHGGFYYNFLSKLIVVTLIFIFSALFTYTLQRFNYTRLLLLGEKKRIYKNKLV